MVYLIEGEPHRQRKLQVYAEETASVEDEKWKLFIRPQNLTSFEAKKIYPRYISCFPIFFNLSVL